MPRPMKYVTSPYVDSPGRADAADPKVTYSPNAPSAKEASSQVRLSPGARSRASAAGSRSDSAQAHSSWRTRRSRLAPQANQNPAGISTPAPSRAKMRPKTYANGSPGTSKDIRAIPTKDQPSAKTAATAQSSSNRPRPRLRRRRSCRNRARSARTVPSSSQARRWAGGGGGGRSRRGMHMTISASGHKSGPELLERARRVNCRWSPRTRTASGAPAG